MKQSNLKILIVHGGIESNTAAGRSIRAIKNELVAKNATVFIAYNLEDAQVMITSDPAIQCVLLNWDDTIDTEDRSAVKVLETLRSRNVDIPVFLMADRTIASEIPVNILEQINDFIWVLDDVPEFIVGRIFTAINRYNEIIQPPMFKALTDFSDLYEYSWHTPGHAGGTAFLKSAVGRNFYSYFGENLFRSDLSISVGDLGSLLDHTGPIGESERYMAHVFGSHRSYHVTNGSSTSNKIILMASITRNQVVLCDRNCHKSLEHSLIMSGAIPNYLIPSRNHYGIIGPVKSTRLMPEDIAKNIEVNSLINAKNTDIDPKPIHAILTNSTYDGLCYNVKKVNKLLGQSVNRLHYDEAWYSYARFHPLYENFFAMSGDPELHTKDDPTIFVTQSTHKLLAALSQASMIHIRDGRNSIAHIRFNESFMMHSSTSPSYPIIASNDISCAMMDGPAGQSLIDEAIKEAISFRKTIAKLNVEYTRPLFNKISKFSIHILLLKIQYIFLQKFNFYCKIRHNFKNLIDKPYFNTISNQIFKITNLSCKNSFLQKNFIKQWSEKGDWFFNIWQPDFVEDNRTKERVAFYEISDDDLSKNHEYWTLKSDEKWHGFGEIEEDYCMLDPIKVSVTTPGVHDDGSLDEFGIPAQIVAKYLEEDNIMVEKTTDFTILFLFSIGVTKGKWGALLNALLEFKYDYDLNKPLESCMPIFLQENKGYYKGLGLKDLVKKMYTSMKDLKLTKKLKDAFSMLPIPDCSPLQAYENLVRGNVESVKLNDVGGRTVATGVIPYPPGIPVVLSGENIGSKDGPIVAYLKALEAFDNEFSGFKHDIHGIEIENNEYKIMCLKK